LVWVIPDRLGREGARLDSRALYHVGPGLPNPVAGLKWTTKNACLGVASINLGGELELLARRAGVKECVRKSPEAGGVIEVIRRMVGIEGKDPTR